MARGRKQKYCPYIFLAFAEMGMSYYEIERLTGVNHSNISTHLRKLGYFRGKGNSPKKAEQDAAKREEGQKHFAEKFAKRYGDRFEYMGGYVSQRSGTHPHIKCKTCSHEFERCIDWRYEIQCPECYRRETERRKALKVESAARKKTYLKHCDVCGVEFETEYETAKRCSIECQHRYANRKNQERRKRNGTASRAEHRKRARKYGCKYDPSVTLRKLIERDGLTCYLCGGECDQSDKSWGTLGPKYPTIDHVVAMANGGSHTWDNVMVAHALCNSEKRDLTIR